MSSLAVLSVLAAPLGAAVAAPAGGKDRIWSPPNTPLPKSASVSGRADHPKSSTLKDSSPNWAPPKAAPKPVHGSAEVALGAPPTAPAPNGGKGDATTEGRAEPAVGASKKAGDLPVWLAPVASAGTSSPAAPVRVQVSAEGTQGPLVSLASDAAGTVRVGLDVTQVTGFGADFARRARLVALPACALTAPGEPACATRTPVPSHYDEETKRLVADVELPSTIRESERSEHKKAAETAAPASLLLALDGAPDGGTGTYSATSLAPSQGWTSGGASGAFTYQYPFVVPPALGGAAPPLALGYDSSSVDGKTASTNAQASWIGDGWDLSPGFVERTYRACDKAGIPGSGDDCWGGANLTLSFGGHAGELVPDGACDGGGPSAEQSGCRWHLKSDDGTKVEFLTGADNGTWNGSYLRVTDTAGTTSYFGLNRLPAANGSPTRTGPESGSAWTVPVFSPNPGDPCYDTSKGKGSWCRTAWRWNLDHVVDTHGNLTTYTYAPETNWYALGAGQNRGRGTNTPYTRAGVLTSVTYGQLLSDQSDSGGTYQAAARVDFETGERCLSDAAACDPAQRTAANAANWPDAPLDKQCQEKDACAGGTPTFWSTKWLNAVTTSVRSGGSYRPVDRYELTHAFKTPQNASDNAPIAWLQSVKRIGKDTANGQAEQPLPEVTFTGDLIPNRVDGLVPARPRYNRPRVVGITTETGGSILVTYDREPCSTKAGRMPASADADTLNCYNVKWFDTSVQTTVDDWFLRHPVTSVTVNPNADLVTDAVAKTVTYAYGPAAWHRNDNALTEADRRTWDQFRGYASVTTVTGSGKDGPQAKSTTSYFQGMDGDIKADGKPRGASVAGVKSGGRTDSDWLAGQALESDTYQDAGADPSAPLSYRVNTYENPVTTATHSRPGGLPDQIARYGSTRITVADTALTTTGSRTATTVTTSDPGNNNRVTTSLSSADGTPDLCTRRTYATSPNAQLTSLVAETSVIAGAAACTAPATAVNTVSRSRTLFDGQDFATAGTLGEGTAGQVLDSYDAGGAPQFVTTAVTAYDTYGRATSTTDPTVSDSANPKGAVVTMTYGAANAGELPNRTVTGTPAPAGAPDAGTARTTTVTYDPARGLPLTSTDANGRTTTRTYDGLGRPKAVWEPGQDTGGNAGTTYDYAVNGTGRPSTVTTGTLLPGGHAYGQSVRIFDGLGRVVQTQSPPAVSSYKGRMITDSFYDSQGRVNRTYNTYYEDTSGPNTTRWIPDGASVPSVNVLQFDGLGRTVSSQFVALGKPQTTTTTAYPGADRTDTNPPAGATATSAVTDARGRSTQLWQYRTPSATGNPADADVTAYTYTPGGLPATRVDPAGNTWGYGYDQRGHVTRTDDPDAGVSTRAYDAAGRLVGTTDARGQNIAITYDLLGRKTGTYNGSVAPANQLTGYTYDTVVKGQAGSTTRYVGGANGAAYTKTVTEYDTAYHQTRTSLSIPGSEIGRAGQADFAFTAAYDPISGSMVNESRAAAGDLAQESLTYNYEKYGLLNDVSGAGYTYLRQADWDAYGRNIRTTTNPWGTQIVTTNTFDEPTGRMLTQYIDKQTSATGTVQNTTYAYNPAGQITAIRTVPDNSPAATDLQCFTYDYLGRLTTAWSDTGQLAQPTPSLAGQGACANASPTAEASAPAKTTVGGSAPYWQDYGYDTVGNRTKLVNHNPTGDPAKDLTTDQAYPAAGTRNTGSGGPHAPTTVKSTFPANGSAPGGNEYDAAGNTTKITNPGGTRSLGAGFVLNPGEAVSSNTTRLTMQPDGNLVLSSLRTGLVTWSTNTQDHPGSWATMQDDGNFVVYDPNRTPLWASNTWAGAGSKYYATVQDDGKFIVYAPGWKSQWGTSTWNATDAASGTTAMSWDAEGHLASLTQGGATTTYLYDADGNQLIRRNPGKVTVNLANEELTYDTGAKTATGTRYYALPGGGTLVRQGGDRLTYQFGDHHSTANLSIDATSTAETRRWTDPYGVARGSGATTAWSGDKGFINGLKDDATGFTNLGARQYQPSSGRFLSPDPLMKADDPQQWNPYGYADDNPVDNWDPTGLALEECASGMAKCSRMGTVIDTAPGPEHNGPNYDRIVAEVKAGEATRRQGYEDYVNHHKRGEPHDNTRKQPVRAYKMRDQLPKDGNDVIATSTVRTYDDYVDKTIGAHFLVSDETKPQSWSETTTNMHQWSEETVHKMTDSYGGKGGGSFGVKDVWSISAEANYQHGDEGENKHSDGKSESTQAARTYSVTPQKGQGYGMAPSVTHSEYETTYYHANGTETRRSWETYEINGWDAVVFPTPPETKVGSTK